MDEQKKVWQKKGCMIMFDGWKDQSGRALINFLVASSGGTFFFLNQWMPLVK